MHHPVVAVWWPRGQWVDQRGGLGRASQGQQRLRGVGGQDGRVPRTGQAGLPGSRQAAQRDFGGVLELASFSSALLSVMASHTKAGPSPRRPGQRPPPLQKSQPLLNLPAQQRVGARHGQDVGDQGGGAGRFSDLQRPVKGGEAGLRPALAWNKKIPA